MNSIVVDGINQTTNDDLLVVARPSNVEIGTNFKLTPQSFIKFLRNNTVSSNSFFPINFRDRDINVPDSMENGIGNSTIDLRETESLTINNYGLITGKTDRTNIGRDFYQISGTINAVLEQGRSYFDSNNSYRSPSDLGTGYNCFVRDSNGTQKDNWSALFDKTYEDFVYSEVTITQGQCDGSNEPGTQSTTKLYIYWGNSTNTTAGALGQINARSKITKIEYTNFNFPDRAQTPVVVKGFAPEKTIGYRDGRDSDYNASLTITSGDAKFLDIYTIEGKGNVTFRFSWDDHPRTAGKAFGSENIDGGLSINGTAFTQPALIKEGSINKTVNLTPARVKNWMTPLARINVNEAGEYDQKPVFAYNLGEIETPLFEIDTLNRKIKKLPITPYNYNANSAQLGLSVTIESF